MTPSDVLRFWFGPSYPDGPPDPRWWVRDPEFDEAIRRRFDATWERAGRGELDGWTATAEGTLALILVLDQFSRNLCRDDPGSWAQDDRALALALDALERGVDDSLDHLGRSFLYMPLMHSEDPAVQERSIRSFDKLVALAPEEHRAGAEHNLRFAHAHKDIIDRFGRYPHRNAVLGRESTPEEIEFLQGPNSSF